MTVVTLLADGGEHRIALDTGRHTVPPDDFEAATGWRVEDRGLCRGDVCVPTRGEQVVVDGHIDMAAAARVMGRAWIVEPVVGVAVLGDPATGRARALASLEAPDFALPDLSGTVHRLSDHRGRKVLLAAYASW